MKTFFILLIFVLVGYFGYKLLARSEIFGPRVEVVTENIKENIGIEPKKEMLAHCAITFVSPTQDSQLTSPVKVEVIVNNSQDNCHWGVFEAQAGQVEITSKDGAVLGKGILKTVSDWMTVSPVTYTASVDIAATYSGLVRITIKDENAEDGISRNKSFISAYLTN